MAAAADADTDTADVISGFVCNDGRGALAPFVGFMKLQFSGGTEAAFADTNLDAVDSISSFVCNDGLGASAPAVGPMTSHISGDIEAANGIADRTSANGATYIPLGDRSGNSVSGRTATLDIR